MLNRARLTLAIAILALAAVIGSVAVVGADSDGNSYLEPPRTLSVNGDGAASAAPDIVDIQLGVETIDEDPKAAIDDNTASMTSVIEALTELDIAEDDIQTRSFNMWVEQIYDEDGPTGRFLYHVVNQISVRVRDIDQTGDVLGAALAAGANTVRGISFGVEDTQALEEAARDAAVDNAIAKAEQLAERLGVAVGSPRHIAEITGGFPEAVRVERAMAFDSGGGSVPVSPGDFTVRVSVNITFDIELPYEDGDMEDDDSEES
ncbi:MAG: SIMPL domain-containing protein [Chloroflexi bacterium]|nr:SIMPL domain-containing protein [Chloroflexota bacterium]